MPKSEAFINMKADIVEITSNIPAGHLTTYAAIAEHLNVVPRHVAYILSTLSHEEADTVPWYRVVTDKGVVKAGTRGNAQKIYLENEGISFAKNAVRDFENLFLPATKLVDWKRKTNRYI